VVAVASSSSLVAASNACAWKVTVPSSASSSNATW
jgi:hypothetical protein